VLIAGDAVKDIYFCDLGRSFSYAINYTLLFNEFASRFFKRFVLYIAEKWKKKR
jgi:hypothetical protein